MIQCIYILESLHELFVIHRDIKPQNFMIKNQKIYLIDYGLATFFVDENGEHLPNKHQESIIGTPKFLSYHNYYGNTLSRRDDLISLGYLYIYLLNGSLPWQNNNVMSSVLILKSLENVNNSHDYQPLKEYMNYCYRIEYHEEPDYELLCKLFMNTLS
jgi:casein kinase 1/casein kinase 1 delta